MAAAQNISPGGALLRASRMFAVPAPLPRPKGKLTSSSIFSSETATLPHPIHMTITTPPSSLSRGDWGLKRPLPLRSTTKTSTPLLRVTTMDTFEHVTEFESAADHTLTLKKWQELGLPLSAPKLKSTTGKTKSNKSVFEENTDHTVPRELRPGQETARWKFNGPWLAGQTDMEFNEYLKKDVRRRRADFHQFLREEYVRSHNSEIQAKARDAGKDISEAVEMEGITLSDITEERFNAHLKDLRSPQNRETKLFRLIREFLDLPPSLTTPTKDMMRSTEEASEKFVQDISTKLDDDTPTPEPANPYSYSGPPKTHPSAGLSYLRTASYINNHPIFGPQEMNTPVPARVIMPRGAGVGSFTPKLGVAGMVIDVPIDGGGFNPFNLESKSYDKRNRESMNPALRNVEPDVHGGTKIWLALKSASLDTEGKVHLETGPATEMARRVAEGKAGKDDFDAPLVKPAERAEPFRQFTTVRRTPGSAGYGLGGRKRGVDVFAEREDSKIAMDMLQGMLNKPE